MKNIQSVEPMIADLGNSWLKELGLDYKLEQEKLNDEIDKALNEYKSKGGNGGNRPDVKLFVRDKHNTLYPVLIEYKGYKEKLVKLDSDNKVENKTKTNENNYNNIKNYAVNGAVHYANAILHYTSYKNVIAIGMTGYKEKLGQLKHQMSVYYVSNENLCYGKKIGEYSDFSFMKKENFDDFIFEVQKTKLTKEEWEKLQNQREKEITASLTKLNNEIYANENGLSETDRIYLVSASIIATLGIEGKVVPLEKSDLISSTEEGNTDGEIIIRKIEAFLKQKSLPQKKTDLIIRTLKNTLLSENINKPVNGESQLKRIFNKIYDDLGQYYKQGLSIYFTGKLFNEMYSWLGFSQDKLNDVVLTPSYVATLMVKLARINKDSYVWDFATGSAGLLVAAMNEIILDAKEKIKDSPEKLQQKINFIRAEQLLGLELLPNVYMLEILNMILMGDGSSNILNMDSLLDFDGKYGFGQTDKDFPATAFLLNPPYSQEGNGMIFVKRALNMQKSGYASIIIQSSAGSGKAKDINKEILKKHTLLASIKMPVDIFIGKSSVQTYIYVFKVNEPHHKDEMVKFIDFTNDGYQRTNRRKSTNNLKDIDKASLRYQEIADLVRFGKTKLNLFSENEYFEGKIDPTNGADWNQSKPMNTIPTFGDFQKTVVDYLNWEITNLLKNKDLDEMIKK
ncbi:N-6 DNA methylase [Mycoplasmopsis cynos]|nr:N-6 DNA methylase [Mycoplasmopsis felis]WQQ11645.1 N-6 DNA methylase [Mycoplasmopsis felis]